MEERNGPYFWGNPLVEEYYNLQGIRFSKSLFTSPRGLSLFTRSWQPLATLPRACIFMVHGNGNDISWNFQATPIFLAQMGFASFALDLQGRGRSEGLKPYAPSLNLVLKTAIPSSIQSIRRLPSMGCPRFCTGSHWRYRRLIHLSNPGAFQGAILAAPMCKISDNFRPRRPIPEILTFLARFFPTWPIVPTPDILDKSVKVAEKKLIAVMNPLRYEGKPNLGTVVELLGLTGYLSQKLGEVRLASIVLHGSADAVTDPDVSRALNEEAHSEDDYQDLLHIHFYDVQIIRAELWQTTFPFC